MAHQHLSTLNPNFISIGIGISRMVCAGGRGGSCVRIAVVAVAVVAAARLAEHRGGNACRVARAANTNVAVTSGGQELLSARLCCLCEGLAVQ